MGKKEGKSIIHLDFYKFMSGFVIRTILLLRMMCIFLELFQFCNLSFRNLRNGKFLFQIGKWSQMMKFYGPYLGRFETKWVVGNGIESEFEKDCQKWKKMQRDAAE